MATIEKKRIYVITVAEKLNMDETGFPDFGSTSVPGWYPRKEDAEHAVTENACDINETCYEYAVIEEIEEGLYNPATSGHRWLYKYNRERNGYEPIPEPECLKHFCGFAMS